MDICENKKMGIFKKFINSTYSFKSYNYFISEKLSKAILYLLLLAFLSATFLILKVGFSFSKEISYFKETLINEVPPFTLVNGELIVDSEMPIIYEDSNSTFVIDTTKEINLNDYDDYSNVLFIGKDKLIVKNNSSKITTTKYSSLIGTNELTSETLNSYLISFGNIIVIIILIFIFIFSVVGKLISLFLIMPLAGLIVSAILNKTLSYSNLIKISSYSLTVPILLKTLLNLIGLKIPLFFILYYGIGVIYLIFALRNINLDINKDLETTTY